MKGERRCVSCVSSTRFCVYVSVGGFKLVYACVYVLMLILHAVFVYVCERGRQRPYIGMYGVCVYVCLCVSVCVSVCVN